MITATISDFRKDMKQYIKRITENYETLIIHRGKDKGIVVLSLEEYNSLNLTRYEMSSKKNKVRLDSAIENFKKGDSFSKELLEE